MGDFNLGESAKELAYEAVAEILLDDQLWYDAKMFVSKAEDTGMTNEEKHQDVTDRLLLIFGEIGKTILDIAIKLAVLWLKNEMKKGKTN